MATNPPAAGDNPTAETQAELPASVRKRLAQLFQYGVDKQKTGDFDYAHSMYSQCAIRDPSNLEYVDAMFDNLKAKYEEANKKKLKVKSSRSNFKKAVADEKWKKVLKLGPTFLQENPWDVPTLRGMAQACEGLHYNEVELRYLKTALAANSKDIEVNKHCATSLARMGQFDQAIACWHRIEEDLKGEARTKITELMMAKARHVAGVGDEDETGGNATGATAAKAQPADSKAPAKEAAGDEAADSGTSADDGKSTEKATAKEEATSSKADEAKKAGASGRVLAKPVEPKREPTAEDLEAVIERNPEECEPYLELADLHDKAGQFREAELVLRRALSASGNSLQVQERLEKAQIRRSKAHLTKAEKDAAEQPGKETKETLDKLRRQHNRMELDVYSSRAERYPDDLGIKYEVAVRLKRSGNFAEAVKYFQEAQSDERCKGSALLAAGECLQQIRQYTAALQSYEKAAEANDSSPDSDTYRLALYRAGVLATGLKDPARAKKWLAKLVSLDSKYRDAADRLDKLG